MYESGRECFCSSSRVVNLLVCDEEKSAENCRNIVNGKVFGESYNMIWEVEGPKSRHIVIIIIIITL